MKYNSLLHELVLDSAARRAGRQALVYGNASMDYAQLATSISQLAGGLNSLGLARGERVAIYLEKRFETVIASFGAPAAGGVFVPLNPLLKAEQTGYIMRDCNVRVLITSPERAALLAETLTQCPDLRHVILVPGTGVPRLPIPVTGWNDMLAAPMRAGHRVIDTDITAILYTSGSTGRPKGVVLSHRNMVSGARSVASYLENHAEDTLVAALPLSFDAGFSQLTTAFAVGARVALVNYLLPRDVLNVIVKEKVTGLTAVPPLYIQLAQIEWPASVCQHLRYFANTGGRMPRETLDRLRARLPGVAPFLMYGLTEAFRSTYLSPNEVDRRPDSIGKAIPGAEILVLREDGSECAVDEVGELVHRGALVGQGYWNDAEKTAERYKPLPAGVAAREAGHVIPEIAVFSGDNVRRDAEGFLYFVGRRDEMIKTSGYRVSPTEVEEVVYSTGLVGESAAFGVDHPALGQAIIVIATPPPGASLEPEALLSACRNRLPAYMVPARIDIRPGPLPRNPNGKIDRKTLSLEFAHLYGA
ncbi:MAG: acyl-CoA ligase (AMP-forming), exosortase A system-associated [Burkholderiales bacterium]